MVPTNYCVLQYFDSYHVKFCSNVITIVITNCRISVDVEKIEEQKRKNASSPDDSTISKKSDDNDVIEKLQKLQHRIHVALRRLRMCDVTVEEVDVVIVKGFVADSLVHVTACGFNCITTNGARLEMFVFIVDCSMSLYNVFCMSLLSDMLWYVHTVFGFLSLQSQS